MYLKSNKDLLHRRQSHIQLLTVHCACCALLTSGWTMSLVERNKDDDSEDEDSEDDDPYGDYGYGYGYVGF